MRQSLEHREGWIHDRVEFLQGPLVLIGGLAQGYQKVGVASILACARPRPERNGMGCDIARPSPVLCR